MQGYQPALVPQQLSPRRSGKLEIAGSQGREFAEGTSAASQLPASTADQSGSAASSPRGAIANSPRGAAASSPRGLAKVPSGVQESAPTAARIHAVRSDDVPRLSFSQAEAGAAGAGPVGRQGSLMSKGKQRSLMQKDLTRRGSVADRLKNVRGMLAADDALGSDDIQEDLPKAVEAASDDISADEPIAEEPQLAST